MEENNGLCVLLYMILVFSVIGLISSFIVNKAIESAIKQKKKEKQFNATANYIRDYNKKRGLK